MNQTFKGFYGLLIAGVLSMALMAGCGGGGGGGGGNAGTTETTSPPKTYMLTVDKFGEGIVTSDISGVNCGDDCSEAYNEGYTVVLTAASSGTNGYQFSSWAGCDSVSGNACTVTMDKDKTVLPSYTRAPILYGTTKIIDDGTLQYLIKREGGTFYFDSQATMAASVIPGDIIAGSTEMGFLRKVTATYISSDGLIVIETTDATLEEAIQEGTVTFTKQLTNADLMSSQLRKGVSLRKAKAADATEFTFDFDNVVYDFEKKSPTSKAVDFDTSVGALNISGSVTLTFEPDFGLDFFIKEWWGIVPITGVKEFKTVLLTTQNNELKITVGDKVDVSEKIKIGTLKFGPFKPDPVTPIWLTPEFNIYVGVDGSVEASLTTSASLTNNLTTGIKYTNDKGWEPIGTYSKDIELEQPTLTGSASIESFVSPECVIWINSIVGPYVNLKGYLGLNGNASTDLSSFELFWRLYYGIDATAGARVEIIGISLGDYSVDILDPNPEWELASGGIYSLVISKSGTGNGTVTSSPTGISCGTDCSENYNSGTQVTLTPTASSGSTFAGWSGGGCSGTGTCAVTMDAAKTVTAAFNLATPTATAPSVSSFSINNGASSSTSRTVTLNNSATGSPTQYMASESSTFSGASWQTYSTAPSFALSSGNAAKTVYFKVKNSTDESTVVSDSISLNEATTSQYTLAVSKSGTGSGTVTSSTGGISCGSTCSASYNSGTSVTLTASASSGSTFAGWGGGGCSGTGSCTVTMDAATTVTATFNQQSATLPDFTVSASVGSSYTSGQTNVQIPVTVTRSGGQITNGTYVTARLYLSTNSTWDVGDTQLWESNGATPDYPVTYLNSNGSRTVTPQVTIPSASSGTYYIIAVVDPTNYQSESNESNNAQPYTVTVTATTANSAPNSPSVLSQYKTDGTAITAAGTTSETSIKLRGNVSDPNSDQVKLQVEIRTTSQSFTGTVTHESGLVSSGGTAEITISGLSNGNYQWRGRTVDSAGLTSGWIDAGYSGADFIVSTNSSPNLPTNLSQFKSDQTTGIPLGGSTSETTVVMKGGVSDPDGNTVQIEIEARPTSQSFTGTPNCQSGVSQSSGGTAHATCSNLTSGNYHWRGRTKDSTGAVSSWQSAGGNADGQTDFIVAMPIAWEFNTSGNLEGWTATNMSSTSATGGSFQMDPAGADPYVSGPNISASAAAYRYVEFRMANNALDGSGTIYFSTQADNSYSESKKVSFFVNFCSLCGNASHYTYTVDMSTNSNWTGTITGIRIDPANNGQGGTSMDTIGIDYIKLTP